MYSGASLIQTLIIQTLDYANTHQICYDIHVENSAIFFNTQLYQYHARKARMQVYVHVYACCCIT